MTERSIIEPCHHGVVRFPDVSGRTLSGLEVTLPTDLPANRTLCLVAFQQQHQGCVDRWIALAESAGVPGSPLDGVESSQTCIVEIPVIGTRWRLGRRFIDGGMAASIRVPRVLARTITVYTDVAAFQRRLNIPNSADVHALVVTRDGEILARSSGEPDDQRLDVILTALETPRKA